MVRRIGRFALFFSVAVMVMVLAACGGMAPEPVVVEKESDLRGWPKRWLRGW